MKPDPDKGTIAIDRAVRAIESARTAGQLDTAERYARLAVRALRRDFHGATLSFLNGAADRQRRRIRRARHGGCVFLGGAA